MAFRPALQRRTNNSNNNSSRSRSRIRIRYRRIRTTRITRSRWQRNIPWGACINRRF